MPQLFPLPRGYNKGTLCNRRNGGPNSQSLLCRGGRPLAIPGIKTQITQPVVWSLFQLCTLHGSRITSLPFFLSFLFTVLKMFHHLKQPISGNTIFQSLSLSLTHTHMHTHMHAPLCMCVHTYEGRTESHEQLFFACELGTADKGECGGGRNQLLCYP